MKELFTNIYDDYLVATISLTNDYNNIKKLTNVKENLFKRSNIDKLLDLIIKLYREENFPIINQRHQNSLYNVLSDIRFNYPFFDEKEKEQIISKVNECIILLNNKDVENIDETDLNSASSLEYLNLYILIKEFEFLIIHYYLQKEKILKDEGLLNFEENADIYVSAIGNLTKLYPELLDDSMFLQKTKVCVNECIKYINQNSNCLDKELNKITLSILNSYNNSINMK